MPNHICTVGANCENLDEMAVAADLALRVVTDIPSLTVSKLDTAHPRDKLVEVLCVTHAKIGLFVEFVEVL